MKFFVVSWLAVWGCCLVLLVSCREDKTGTSSSEASIQVGPDSLVNVSPAQRIETLKKQIQGNPRDYSLLVERSEIYYSMDSVEAAIRDIDLALTLYPTGPDLHYLRGFYALAINDTAQALDSYQKAIGLGTQNPEAYYQLGQVYFFQDKPDQALVQYQKAADYDDTDPTYPFAMGLLEETRLSYIKAIKHYKHALELDSTFAKPLTQLFGLYLNGYQNETEALKYNEQLLRVRPGHPLGRFQKGSYHLRRAFRISSSSRMKEFQEQINQAVVEFSIALNRDPQFTQAWYNRGYCYFLGDTRINEAVTDFEKCLELDPNHSAASFMLGSINEKSGDLQTALGYYERAYQLQPDNKDFQKAVSEVKTLLQ